MDDISEMLRTQAIEAALEEDEALQRSVIDQCKSLFGRLGVADSLLSKNEKAATPQQVLEYWQTSSTPILDLFRPSLEGGDQPVFAAISLLTSYTAFTVFVPVPFNSARKDVANLADSLWLNSAFCRKLEGSTDLLENTARSVSHALTNISYSVWIEDEPEAGWLAAAHASPQVIYIRDVGKLHANQEAAARSVAWREEAALAMASVLYIPVYRDKPSKAEPAPAVLMLWSPVPGRWDHCFTEDTPVMSAGARALVSHLALSEKFFDELWREFRWAPMVAARDATNYRRNELQSVNFMLSLMRWSGKQEGDVKEAIDEFLHHGNEPILSLARSNTETVSLKDWLADLVCDHRGFVNRVLAGPSLEETRLVLKQTNASDTDFSISELQASPGKLSEAMHSNAHIALERSIARQIAAAPADNIIKYAESLEAITVSISHRFVIVDFVETPMESAKGALANGDVGFKRYFAIRRGLPVSPFDVESQGQSSSGLGLWINRMLESRNGIATRLYVSPDHQHWLTSIIIRLQHDRLGEHDRPNQTFALRRRAG